MTLYRFLVSPSDIRGSTVTIDDPAQLHHIRDVLRLGRGDRLACFDGEGSEWIGMIAHAGQRRLVIHVEERRTRPAPSVRIWVGQALLKADRFDWVVEKSTELGAAGLSPLTSAHTVVRLSAEQARSRHQRWQRIAVASAKQCRRTTIPVIDPPQPLETFLRRAEPALLLIPTLAVTTIPLREVLSGHQGAAEVAVLIGPEGDFSPEEVALAERFGARPVSLGPLTLRAETAAVAALAMLRYALDS